MKQSRAVVRSAPLLIAAIAASVLGGCQLLGGGDDPAEQRAERLRQPPDLLAGVDDPTAVPPAARQQTTPAQTGATRSTLEQVDGRPQLVVAEGFYDAWRRVGLAVDRLGFTLEDRNRAEGRYFVRYDPRAEQGQEPEGFFESLAFWRDDEPDDLALYVIQLAQDGSRTLVTVTDEAGKPAPAEIAERILALLREQLG